MGRRRFVERMKTLVAVLVLALPALAGEVSGYVYAIDGSAVEGATVRAGNATTTTNEAGAFALRNLAEGVIELDVDGKVRPLVLTGDVVSITLTDAEPLISPRPDAHGEGTVSGKVTLDGKPLANAPVIVGGMRAVTNARGEYVASGLSADRHAITLDERLLPRIREQPFVADLSESREATVNLDLLSAPMIRGRVVDAEGQPVPRARVQLVLANRSPLDFAFELAAPRTTPAGRFAFPAPEWAANEQVSVAVTPLLHSTVRSKPFLLGSAGHDVEVTLPKLETVRIRVLDRAGKAVPESRVAFASTSDTATFESIELLVEDPLAQRAARTNAGGEVVVRLAADSYDFIAAADGFQTATVRAKSIAKPVTLDITLERAALLRGRVHRGARGVADVNVNLHGASSRRGHVTTDAEGRFDIEGLAPGTYRVTFFKQEELIDRTMDVEAPGDVDVALPPAGKLRGRVFDAATGEPVRELAFSVESSQSGTSGIHRGQSTADGTFTVEIPAGSYRVTAGAANFTSSEPVDVRVVENETTSVDLPLGRGATIAGRVTDESGLPVAGADVTVMAADFERTRMRRAARVGPSHTRTADDGTFTATGADPGEVQLTVRKQGYVLHRKTIVAEGSMSVDVTLTRGSSIRGTVTRGGRPVAGAQVGASSAAIGGEHQATVSGDDGRFTLSGLIAARYTVSAFLEDQYTQARDVDPAKQQELVLSLDAKTRGVIYGIVTGIPPIVGGKYLRRAVMVHSDAGGAEGMIDDAGNYRIEDAPLGPVAVTAVVEASSRAARASARKQVEVIDGQPLRVDLELAGNVRVSGRITIEGRPVANAEIGFSSNEGGMGSTRSREDGTYEILLGTPGLYHIYARAEQFQDRHFQTYREIRGGETIDVDLREQVIEGTVVDAVTRQPIAGALVTLAPATGVPMSIVAEVPADANGRFRIVTTASGPLRLIATAHGYAQRALPASANTPHSFELTPAPDVRIRVLDARTGAPLDAHVIFSDEAGILPVRPRRSADGTTYVFSLAPGRYRVLAVVQGYAPKTVEVAAPGALDIVME